MTGPETIRLTIQRGRKDHADTKTRPARTRATGGRLPYSTTTIGPRPLLPTTSSLLVRTSVATVEWQDRLVLADTRILVTTRRDDATAAVRRDADGHSWISLWPEARPDRVAGSRLEGVEPARILGPDWLAVGGMLPPSATSAEVRGEDDAWHPAEVSEGAWVAFAPHDAGAPGGLPAVRFCDDRGAPVSRAISTDLSSARRLDAGQAELLASGASGLGGTCPACGATDWRAVAAGPAPGAERIFCGVCGHGDGAVHGVWSPGA